MTVVCPTCPPPTEQVALGSSYNECKQAAYRTPNVKECYGADGWVLHCAWLRRSSVLSCH